MIQDWEGIDAILNRSFQEATAVRVNLQMAVSKQGKLGGIDTRYVVVGQDQHESSDSGCIVVQG